MADLKLKILIEAFERISEPFKKATQSTDAMKAALKGATETVRSLEKASAQVDAFARLKRDAQANATALAEAQKKAQALGRELAEAGGGSRKAQAAFSAARREVERLEAAETSITRETQILRNKLAEAGISTKNLGTAQAQLKRDIDAAKAAAVKEATALDTVKAKMDAIATARAKMSATQERAGKMAGSGAGAMAAGGAGLMAGVPVVTTAGDFQHELAAYGLTAGQTSQQLQQVRDKLRSLSVEVNQSSMDLLAGQSILVGKGLDPDAALGAIGTIGRAVTATGAEMADMSNLAFSVMDNLKVPQQELAQAMNIMAKAGDLGGFELKDMANTFPQLTASAHMLGMSGAKAIGTLSAALQIATKGAADPSEAANNFANFLQKATAPDTVKNFEKKGIDIKAALQKGLMTGEDPIDVMMKQIGKATGVDFEKEIADAVANGGDAKQAAESLAAKFNLGELFGDVQVQNFLAPMMANMKEFHRIRDEAMNSDGTVDNKFTTMMATFNESTKGLGNDFKNTMEAIGTAMLPVLTPLANGLRGIVQAIGSFANDNPRLTATIGMLAGALAGLVFIGGTLTVALASLLGPFAMVRFAASTLFPVLIGGIRAVGVAFASNPIGLILTGIAVAAGLVIAYWEPIKGFFADLWTGITSGFSAALQFIQSGFDVLKPILAAIGIAFGATQAAATPAGKAPPVKIAAAVSPAAASVAGKGNNVNMGGVAITVHGAPGQSPEEIGKQVRLELEKAERRKAADTRARLYDGEK
ncbi:MAG TPA: phage tail tape measure protein [Candidatus Sulfotelmatobacter sp.]|jgi:TP901 family phage tail tape measure protein|nr:phage tail tape measure protein [Candidatus Sulfotelmatobacter sp.]